MQGEASFLWLVETVGDSGSFPIAKAQVTALLQGKQKLQEWTVQAFLKYEKPVSIFFSLFVLEETYHPAKPMLSSHISAIS